VSPFIVAFWVKLKKIRVTGGHYQGTFSRRDNDVVSFMIAYARTNSRLTRYQEDLDTVAPGPVGIQTYESIAECTEPTAHSKNFSVKTETGRKPRHLDRQPEQTGLE
jgi:hypothetical protein